MKIKSIKKTLLLLSSLFINISIFGQDKETLSTKEYREDWNTLCTIIKEANPYSELRKSVYGYDMLQYISDMSDKIEDTTSLEDFYLLVNKALMACHDMHISTLFCRDTGLEKYYGIPIDEKTIALNIYYAKIKKTKPNIPICLSRIDGKSRVTIGHFKIEPYFILPFGSELITIEGADLHTFLLETPYITSAINYDSDAKTIYVKQLNIPKNIQMKSMVGDTFSMNREGLSIRTNIAKDKSERIVYYFEEEKILYIRLPEMLSSFIPYYEQEIYKHRDDSIEKVVIDIRGNEGGSDRVWRRLLELLIDQPISANFTLAFKNTKTIEKALDNLLERNMYDVNFKELPDTIYPFLPDVSYKLLSYEQEIVSDTNSIKYANKIILLSDDEIFSSAGAFLSYANKLPEKFVSIGNKSGYFLGRGISPLCFILPNSRIAFRLPACVETSGASSILDLMQNNVNIPITFDINDHYIRTMYLSNGIYTPFFLTVHDKSFRKAMELKFD